MTSVPVYADDLATLYVGDCLDVLRELPDDSVDSVVTDPPYGLSFMGKAWDDSRMLGQLATGDEVRGAFAYGGSHDRGYADHDANGFQVWSHAWARECLRVLKPGGHMLTFGGTRTWHRLAVAIEDAGFEIRDSIAWMYGSGFPKSLDVSKAIDKAEGIWRGRAGATASGNGSMSGANYKRTPKGDPATSDAVRWQGWGTALKPAHEPIVVARKPLIGTVAANVLEHGTGALNIDGCRIPSDDGFEKAWDKPVTTNIGAVPQNYGVGIGDGEKHTVDISANKPAGRWPANVILDEDQAAALDEQSGNLTSNGGRGPHSIQSTEESNNNRVAYGDWNPVASHVYGDSGGASRFFYVAKAPARERPKVDGIAHPTVKPFTLMQYLTRLVTPPGGTILEPFAGSGTTIQAAYSQGFRCIAIEKEADYIPLIIQRIKQTKQEKDDQLPYDT